MAQINSCLSGKKLFPTWLCKGGLHSLPLKWKGKLLRDSRLEGRLQYGGASTNPGSAKGQKRGLGPHLATPGDVTWLAPIRRWSCHSIREAGPRHWDERVPLRLGIVGFSHFRSHVICIYLTTLRGMMPPPKSSDCTSDTINSGATSFGVRRDGR